MARFRSTWFLIAATTAWIAVLSGGMGIQAPSARHGDEVAPQVTNDVPAPFHIAFLAPNELVSSDDTEAETHEVDQEPCDGANPSSSCKGLSERRRPHDDLERSSPPSFRFSARGPPRA